MGPGKVGLAIKIFLMDVYILEKLKNTFSNIEHRKSLMHAQ